MKFVDERDRMGQVDRFRPSGSSSPFSIEATFVLGNSELEVSLLNSDTRDSNPRVKFEFSIIVATFRRGALYLSDSALQSNCIRESLAASQTCIASYGWTRDWSTCFHAPIDSRNSTDDGVRLLARFKYWSGGDVHCLALLRSWDSTSAILRLDVNCEDSMDILSD